jgi:uncharacterized protein YndB with AHSA1/START domain
MNDLATITGRSTLTFVRYLPGPIERVWSYLTDPTYLASWFSAGSVAGHVGGDVRFEMGAHGNITAYEPPRVLEYTWNEEETPCGPIPDALVRWELAQEGNRVRLTLTHSRLAETALVSLGAGWHTFLDRLNESLAGQALSPLEETYGRLEPVYASHVGALGKTLR